MPNLWAWGAFVYIMIYKLSVRARVCQDLCVLLRLKGAAYRREIWHAESVGVGGLCIKIWG